MVSFMYRFLQLLPPETAHNVGLRLLRISPIRVNPCNEIFRVKTSFGILDNPIGLAAGYDKSASYLEPLSRLGFGYIVAGTVTRKARLGKPKPRLVRRPSEMALVNAMGFPNPGLEKFVEKLSHTKTRYPVVASIADEDPEKLVECYTAVQEHVSAVEVNISSPNTPELRRYFHPEFFKEVVVSLYGVKQKPTFLKIPPPTSADEVRLITKVVGIWLDQGFEGVTAVNALLVDEPNVAVGRGGLSGRPLLPHMLECVRTLRNTFGEGFELHAVGGILTGHDMFKALEATANTVQIYTALAYRGPYVVRYILEELAHIMKERGLTSINELNSSSTATS
jgi:dihydroorotate dehydrogenase